MPSCAKNAAPATLRPFGRASHASASTTKFQAIGQPNHQLCGCVRPFIAPCERSVKTAMCSPATGIAKQSPLRVNAVSANSAATIVQNMKVDLPHGNFSPM